MAVTTALSGTAVALAPDDTHGATSRYEAETAPTAGAARLRRITSATPDAVSATRRTRSGRRCSSPRTRQHERCDAEPITSIT